MVPPILPVDGEDGAGGGGEAGVAADAQEIVEQDRHIWFCNKFGVGVDMLNFDEMANANGVVAWNTWSRAMARTKTTQQWRAKLKSCGRSDVEVAAIPCVDNAMQFIEANMWEDL